MHQEPRQRAIVQGFDTSNAYSVIQTGKVIVTQVCARHKLYGLRTATYDVRLITSIGYSLANMTQDHKKNRGFTLVEVMVALVIISVSIVTLLATHVESTRSYAEAKASTICGLLAQQKLAELQIGGFPEPGETSGVFENYDSYRWKLSIEETDMEELREITLEVSLTPPEGSDEPPALGGVTVVTYLVKLEAEEEEEEEEE